jgi:hypothetical protein
LLVVEAAEVVVVVVETVEILVLMLGGDGNK